MPRRRDKEAQISSISTTPALTADARESQLINMAYDEAEKRIKNGDASDTLLVQFLKMGSLKERTKQQILEKEVLLAEARTEALNASRRSEESYERIIRAFAKYSGQDYEGE